MIEMKICRNIYILFAVTLPLVLACCSGEEPMSGIVPTRGEGILVANIDPGASVETRSIRAASDDQWSYVRFNSITDTIGFYSAKGNLSGEGGNGPFTNEPMVWERSTGSGDVDSRWRGIFRGVNMNYDVGLIQTENNNTFVYFPYNENADASKGGMELRRKGPDGSERCVDALYILHIADNQDAVMSGSFIHGFSELMITRGYGFDNPPAGKEDIYVVLDKGYSHVQVADYGYDNHDYWKVLLPVYKEGYKMTQEQCRRWKAWEGDSYKANELSDPVPAYYCIVPTSLSNYRSVVDYIEICDNNGTWHKITSFYLYLQNDKRVQPSQRYLLEIVLEGLVPTVYPYGILPWENVTNITEQRNAGISNPSEFAEFVTTYNSYIKDDGTRNDRYEEEMKKYGDMYVTDGKKGFHFYINNNLDIGTLESIGVNYRINNLCDTIDGLRNTLSNIKLKDTSGFIGNMRDGSCLMNVNVTGLTIDNPSSELNTGGLVDILDDGLITGCNIDGYINTRGKVGMAAAEMRGGTITGCSFTGLLVGSDTYNRMFAVPPLVDTWKSNNNNGVIFTEY